MNNPSRRFCLLCLLIVMPTISVLSQSTQLIPWDAQALLTWADFQGVPPADAGQLSEAASIHMTIKWHASYSVRSQRGEGYSWMGSVQVIASNLMNPRFSWVVPSRATAAILRHEQFHFNLSEVYKRKLVQALDGLQVQGNTAEATMTALDELTQQTGAGILDQFSAMTDRYDQETANSTDSDAQAKWENDIQVWLATPSLAP